MLKFIQELTARLFPANSLRARFSLGTFWSMAGTMIAQSLMVVASIFVARILGKSGYGELGIIISTVGMFGGFAGMGLGLTATKHVAEFRATDAPRAGRIIGLSTMVALSSSGVVSIVLFVFAPYLAAHTLNAPQLAPELRIGCVLLFFNAMTGAQNGALAGLESFKSIAVVNLAVGLTRFPLLLGGVYYWGLLGAVSAHAIVSGVGFAIMEWQLLREAARHQVPVSYHGVMGEIPILWSFSVPLVLSSILVGPVYWIANTILVNQPEGYSEMGILNACKRWENILLFLPGMFVQVSLPLMSSSLGTEARGEKGIYGKVFMTSQSLMVAIVLPLGTAFMFFSDMILRLYGKGFEMGGTVLIGISATNMIISLGSVAGTAIQAKGRMWFGLLINLSWGLVFIAAAWVLAPSLGAKAVAFSSAGSYLVTTIWAFIYLRPELPEGMFGRILTALAFISMLTASCVLLTPSVRLMLAAPAVAMTTIITYFFFIDVQVRSLLIKVLRSLRGPGPSVTERDPGERQALEDEGK